jgi:hypothetical protein
MKINTESLKQKCRDKLHRYDRVLSRTTDRDDFSPAPYRFYPTELLALAGCLLRENKESEARRTFVKSGLYGRQLVRVYQNHWDKLSHAYRSSIGVHTSWGIYGAFLGGDPRVIDGIREDLIELDEAIDIAEWDAVPRYIEMTVLLSLWSGNDDLARRQTAHLPSEIDHDVAYDTIRQRVHEALVDRDATATETALQEFADSYRDIVDEADVYWMLPMSYEAATYHLLARHLGLEISVESDEIPDGIASYELGDRIDLPRPEHVDADLIPDA